MANTFGKDSTLDYVLACVFNVFYILNLGLSEEEDYQGPVFGKARAQRSQQRPPHGGGRVTHPSILPDRKKGSLDGRLFCVR